MRQTRGIAAYGFFRNDAGRVLLTNSWKYVDVPGAWQLPGGRIAHGEHPADAVVRHFVAQTGLTIETVRARAAVSDVLSLPSRGISRHTDRIIYDVEVSGAGPVSSAGMAGQAHWLADSELAGLPLMPFTAEWLGQPVDAGLLAHADDGQHARGDAGPYDDEPEIQLPVDPGVLGSAGADLPLPSVDGSGGRSGLGAELPTGQRFAAYGLVTEPGGRVLLTLIADGYPGAGHWHLPGGGTDHGEQPVTGFLRELIEEAGQVGRVTELLGVYHRRSAAVGPEGYPLDWHAVRALYRAVVDAPTEPRVMEATGGSTAQAAWFAPAELGALPMSEIAAAALRVSISAEPDGAELRS